MTIRSNVRPWGALGLILAASLVGCGGGGDSPVPATPATAVTPITAVEVPVQSAMAAYAQTRHMFSLGGSTAGTGETYVMDYSYEPGAAADFEGSTVPTALNSTVVRKRVAGQPDEVVLQQSLKLFFKTSPVYAIQGAIDQTSGGYTVTDWSGGLPATARIGQSGALGTETAYADSTKAGVTGTSTLTWSVEADTEDSVLMCILAQFPGTTSSNTNCYRIDRSGAVTGLIVRITNDQGATLTLK